MTSDELETEVLMTVRRCPRRCGGVGIRIAVAILLCGSAAAQSARIQAGGKSLDEAVTNREQPQAQARAPDQGEPVTTPVSLVSDKSLKRIHVFITGKVQGVGFRAFTSRAVETLKLKVTGWVKNLPDGRVELVAEGPASDLARFMADVAKGPSASRVDTVVQKEETYTGEFGRFTVD